MAANEHRYVSFPIHLLQETFIDPEAGLSKIIVFGVMNYAKRIDINLEDAARQMMYCYYRDKEMLPADLHKALQQYIDAGSIEIDEDYNGFSSKGFDPEIEIHTILPIFEKDAKFKALAVTLYQIKKAIDKKNLNISIGSIDGVIRSWEKSQNYMNEFESQYGKDCWAGIKPAMLFDFRGSGKDIEVFRAYMAVKSIIGPHNFTATTRNVILMRMLGCKSNQALKDFLKANKQARETYNRYTRSDKALRYHFDKLFETLLERGFLMSKIFERKVSRKIFISHKLSYNELANEIINFHNKRNHARDEQQAIQRIRATI